MRTLSHARALAKSAREVLLAAGVLGLCAAAPQACGARVDDSTDAGADAKSADGGDDATSPGDASSDDTDPDVADDVLEETAPADAGCVTSTSDAGSSCGAWMVEVLSGTKEMCGLPSGNGWGAACARLCGERANQCFWVEGPPTRVECREACVVDGRRPAGLEAYGGDAAGLGSWFASLAFHEAASVHAFDALVRELSSRSAPASLLASLGRARRDERRHAAMAARLARRFGARTTAPRVRAPRGRSLRDIALENAREGCVRETLGVMIGVLQAERARDPAVRAFYRAIARDEARHAAVSWRMHAWLMRRLSPAARRDVARAMRRALATMGLPDVPADLAREIGLPTGDEMARIVAQYGKLLPPSTTMV